MRNESAGDALPQYRRFARVGISVPPGTSADEVHGIIPFDSARVSLGFTQDTALEAGSYYPCLEIDRAPIRAMLDEQEWCALQDPLCATLGPTEVTAGGQVYFIFPLRDDAWDRATMDDSAFFKPSLYLDFMLSTRDAGGTRILTRVETRTEITAPGIASMCDERRLEGSLGDIISIDMFMGLTPDRESMSDTLLQSRDLTRQGPAARHFERDTSSVASNVLTLLVKGDPAVFAQSYAQNYALEVEDMVTMHFLDAGIRTQVEALMSAGLAFRKEVDSSSYTSMRIVPTDALLNLCPLQATRNVQGCIMRKEIEARLLDFTTQAIVGIAPVEGGSNADDVEDGASAWLQNLLGDSTFIGELGANHSRTMATEFLLNDRFRKGFLINPTIPWRQAQMDAAGAATSLDLAQDAISVVLVTLDKNIEAGLAPMVEISLPATLQVPADELRTNTQLQEATEASYADAADVPPESVSIDTASITDDASSARRRRHLLQAADGDTAASASCSFDMKIAINVQDEEVAMSKAEEIRKEAQEPTSKFTQKLVRSVNRRVRAVAKDMPPVKTLAAIIPPDAVIKPPVNLEKCYDNTAWSTEIDTAALDNIYDFISSGNNGHKLRPTISCSRRWLRMYDNYNGVTTEIDAMLDSAYSAQYANKAFEVNVSPRGPQTDGEWLQYEFQSENWSPAKFASSHRNFRAGTLFWADFCDDPPPNIVGNLHGAQLETVLAEWRRIGDLARTHCCVCKPQAKIPGTKERYVHRYSWIFESAIAAGVSLFDRRFYDKAEFRTTMYRNFQFVQNYLAADGVAVESGYDASNLRGPADVCDDGSWWAAWDQCALCPVGSYKFGTGTSLTQITTYATLHNKQAQQLDEHRGVVTGCTPCARGMSTLHPGSTSADACMCARGFTRSTSDPAECAVCPRGSYKDALGDGPCTPCPRGLVSRAGATSLAQCAAPLNLFTEYDEKHVYDPVLGLLSFARPVEPAWTDPPAYYTSNDRRCALLDDDRSVSCPEQDYVNVFPAAVPAPQQNDFAQVTDFRIRDDYSGSPILHMKNLPITWLSDEKTISVHRHPTLPYRNLVDDIQRDDFADTVRAIEIYSGQSYEAPAPPGFAEEILAGQPWPLGTTINYRIRGRADYPAQTYLVSFLTNQRLNDEWDSTDYRFLLCAQWSTERNQGWYLELCKDQPDPQNPAYQNQRNPYVLDGFVHRIGSDPVGSCFNHDKNWWSTSCDGASGEPQYDKHFDIVKHWRPFTTTPPVAGPYFLYTIFHYYDTAACRYSQCIENVLYATYPTNEALFNRRSDTWLRMHSPVTLLPGSEVTYGTPVEAMEPDEVDTSAVFAPGGALLADAAPQTAKFDALGFLNVKSYQTTPPERAHDDRACVLDAPGTGIACTDAAASKANILDPAADADTAILHGALPAPHLKVAHDPACGTVPYTVDAACVLRKASSTSTCHVDALAEGPAQEPRYTKHDENRNWASAAEGSTCSSTPLAAGSACGNVQSDSATDAWPLPVLATSAYTFSSTVVQNDDGWEFEGAGGWCPDYTSSVREHLTLDLGSVQTVSGLAVQTRGFACCYSQFFHDFAAETSEDGVAFTAVAWRAQAACPCVYRITRTHADSNALFSPRADSNSIEVFRGANTTLAWPWTHATRKLYVCGEILSDGVCHAPLDHVYVDLERHLTHVFIPSDFAGDVLFFYTTGSGDAGYNGIINIVDPEPADQVCAACPTRAAAGVLAGVAASDPSTVNERTVALFASSVTARYVRIRPEFRAFGCLRASALGPLLPPSGSDLVFAAGQSSEAYVAVSLGAARTVRWVQVFVPPGTYHVDVLLGDDAASPLNNALCGTHALSEAALPAYRLRAARDVEGVGISVPCVGVGSVVVVRLPVCENGNTVACNAEPLPLIREVRVLSPQAVFSGSSKWSWSHAERLGETVTLAPGITVEDPYSRPQLVPAPMPGVHAQSLVEVHQQWCGVREHGELWLHLDLGHVRAVAGLHLQSIDRHLPWRRPHFRVELVSSAADVFDPATAVASGVLDVNDEAYAREDPEGATASFTLTPVLRARHLRFYVPDVERFCLRVGVVDCDWVCEDACLAPAGVSVVEAEGGFAIPAAGTAPTLVHVPAANPAAHAEVTATFAALDPAKSVRGHSVQVICDLFWHDKFFAFSLSPLS